MLTDDELNTIAASWVTASSESVIVHLIAQAREANKLRAERETIINEIATWLETKTYKFGDQLANELRAMWSTAERVIDGRR